MDRQRILMIFGIALAAAAVLTWVLFQALHAPKTETMVKVAAAARDMAAGTRLRAADVKLMSLPEKDLPKGAILDHKAALDRVLLFPVNSNEPLISTRMTGITGVEGLSATIEPGKRAISVPISDASGAAGLIQPRSHVDVLFTRPGTMQEAITTTVLQDVIVLSIGRVTEVSAQPSTVDPRTAAATQQRSATLLVTPQQAAKLELAKNQGKISLALRNPLDRSIVEDDTLVTAEVLDPMYMGRRRMATKGGKPLPNIRDKDVWAKLTGEDDDPPKKKEPPPKPKYVVDVYRGDKHVQEIFQ